MKDEMGIVAFGKRKKLELAISELRRPASLSSGASMRHVGQSNTTGHSQQQSASTGFSLNSPISSAFTTQEASVTSVDTPLFEESATPASSDFGAYSFPEKVFLSSLYLDIWSLMNYPRSRKALSLPQVMACFEKEVAVGRLNAFLKREK
jgi:hypothetical protein